MARTGRRPGGSGTQQAILDAARSAFGESGYDGATIRSIAAKASVDPALVHHYYGTKERLFVTAMQLPLDPATMIEPLLAKGIDGLGERIVTLLLSVWESTGSTGPFAALLRSALTNERAATMFREFIDRALFSRIAAAIEVDRPEFRAGMAASQMAGIIVLRYLVQLPAVVNATPEEIIAAVAPTVQRYLAEPLD
jgi:AcrR family transcriptional regulator